MPEEQTVRGSLRTELNLVTNKRDNQPGSTNSFGLDKMAQTGGLTSVGHFPIKGLDAGHQRASVVTCGSVVLTSLYLSPQR